MNKPVTRLKMKVERVSPTVDKDGNTQNEFIYLNAAYSDNPESTNALWSKWTPSGSLQYNVSNPNLFGKIKAGEYFFVELIPTTEESL